MAFNRRGRGFGGRMPLGLDQDQGNDIQQEDSGFAPRNPGFLNRGNRRFPTRMPNEGQRQDSRFATPQVGNRPFGGQRRRGNNNPYASPVGRGIGRRPGSGGSRVMSRPTMGGLNKSRRNRLQRGVFPSGNTRSNKMGY